MKNVLAITFSRCSFVVWCVWCRFRVVPAFLGECCPCIVACRPCFLGYMGYLLYESLEDSGRILFEVGVVFLLCGVDHIVSHLSLEVGVSR